MADFKVEKVTIVLAKKIAAVKVTFAKAEICLPHYFSEN